VADHDPLRELREEIREFTLLREHPGWKRLERYAAAQREGRINDLLLRVDTKTKEVHYTRGELAGIKLFIEIPATEIARLNSELERAQKEIEENDDENSES
jgi:hypothetical protein